MKKKGLILIFLSVFLLSSCLSMLSEEWIKKAKEKDTDTGGVIYRNLKYKCPSYTRRYLDIYMPPSFDEKKASKDEKYPVVIYFHGGSWVFGDKSFIRFFDDINNQLWENDIAIVTVNYRFAHRTLSFAELEKDIKEAVNFIIENSEIYHLDKDNIGLWGMSAGAHLALLYGVKYPKGISCIIDEYGPTDIVALSNIKGDKKNQGYGFLKIMTKKHRKSVSPYFFVSEKTPPIIVFHGDADELVPISQSKKLVKIAKEKGVEVEFNIIEGGNHVFTNEAGKKSKKQRIQKMLDFILKHLK